MASEIELSFRSSFASFRWFSSLKSRAIRFFFVLASTLIAHFDKTGNQDRWLIRNEFHGVKQAVSYRTQNFWQHKNDIKTDCTHRKIIAVLPSFFILWWTPIHNRRLSHLYLNHIYSAIPIVASRFRHLNERTLIVRNRERQKSLIRINTHASSETKRDVHWLRLGQKLFGCVVARLAYEHTYARWTLINWSSSSGKWAKRKCVPDSERPSKIERRKKRMFSNVRMNGFSFSVVSIFAERHNTVTHIKIHWQRTLVGHFIFRCTNQFRVVVEVKNRLPVNSKLQRFDCMCTTKNRRLLCPLRAHNIWIRVFSFACIVLQLKFAFISLWAWATKTFLYFILRFSVSTQISVAVIVITEKYAHRDALNSLHFLKKKLKNCLLSEHLLMHFIFGLFCARSNNQTVNRDESGKIVFRHKKNSLATIFLCLVFCSFTSHD